MYVHKLYLNKRVMNNSLTFQVLFMCRKYTFYYNITFFLKHLFRNVLFINNNLTIKTIEFIVYNELLMDC